MSKGTQRDYWNSRANVKGNYGPPLNLSTEEEEFQREHLKPGGTTLVMGATTALCTMASETSDKVVSVDSADKIIEALRIDGVEYLNLDWNEYLEGTPDLFDNIVTDGGMMCLEFPGLWQRTAQNIQAHLTPGGVFAAKFYISGSNLPKSGINANMDRFMTIPALEKNNWMITPTHTDYQDYDVRYARPPKDEVLRIFGQLSLISELIPDYEAGEYFPSFAWQRS